MKANKKAILGMFVAMVLSLSFISSFGAMAGFFYAAGAML